MIQRSVFVQRFTLAFPVLAMLLVAGCSRGPTLGRVEGTVTLDGQPLAGANVEFQPATGSPSYGTTDAAGHYVLQFAPEQPGALPGEHTVRITTYQASAEPGSSEVAAESVPAKYNSETELKKTVETGSQEIDFPLTSE